MNKNQLLAYLNKLQKLQTKAYASYSHFRVAAIVVLKNKIEFAGVNIENAAFPAAICAERVALAQVITYGYQQDDINFLILITDSKQLGSPCGLCRQVMIELMPEASNVYICNAKSNDLSTIATFKVKDLLPMAFSYSSLKE